VTRHLLAHPFEFAPRAARFLPLSWILLLGGIAVLTTGSYLIRDANRHLEAAHAQQNLALRAQKARAHQAEQLARDPRAYERLQAQKKLEALLQMPWSLLLDALEAATDSVEGRVTLLSMSPSSGQASLSTRKVELLMVAKNYGAMLAYVDAMKDIGGFSDVRIVNHQMDAKVGPEALRFQVNAGWNQLKEGVFLARDIPATAQGVATLTGPPNTPRKGEKPGSPSPLPAETVPGMRP
jgi:Tfp pilus assembly protein PilN